MKVQEQFPLTIVTDLPVEETSGSMDHAAAVDQMEAVDAIMRFYFGVEDWLNARNKFQPGLQVGNNV